MDPQQRLPGAWLHSIARGGWTGDLSGSLTGTFFRTAANDYGQFSRSTAAACGA